MLEAFKEKVVILLEEVSNLSNFTILTILTFLNS